MKLIAKKPCSFGGKKFFIGDTIPTEHVINPKEFEKQGVLVIVEDGAEPKCEYVIHTEAGDLHIDPEVMQSVFDVLIGKAEDVNKIIDTITDGDALILLHQAEQRKGVKSAIEARAKNLEGGGE